MMTEFIWWLQFDLLQCLERIKDFKIENYLFTVRPASWYRTETFPINRPNYSDTIFIRFSQTGPIIGKTFSGHTVHILHARLRLPQHLTTHDDLLDLRGSLVNLVDLGIAHQLLDRVLAVETSTTEDLNSIRSTARERRLEYGSFENNVDQNVDQNNTNHLLAASAA